MTTSFPWMNQEIAQDTVEYWIYLQNFSSTDTPNRLSLLLEEIFREISHLIDSRIWQKDCFHLDLIKDSEGIFSLFGSTCFGDCIQDEWFIVYLLRTITQNHKDLLVRVVDSDGDFLLIEAAYELPDWVNPGVADNRLWMNDGKLLLIPPSYETVSSRTQALTILGNESLAKLTVSRDLEMAAFKPIEGLPQNIDQHYHYARVHIPRSVAAVLYSEPKFISQSVESFYHRDPSSLKISEKMSRFPAKDLVPMSIQFTKTLYAQVKGQVFHPPSIYPIPPPEDPDYTKYVTGMKVACGMEMAYANDGNLRARIDKILSGPLPTDETIAHWINRQDDESWLLIDVSDLGESGPSSKGKNPSEPNEMQNTVKNMLDKLQEFMNEEGGVEGIELDEEKDDSDAVVFDEEDFERLLRQHLEGIPDDENSNSDSQASDIAAMDAEFNELMVKDETIDDLNIDYEVAKNMLESFKGQAGLPGPAGNVLSRMGINLPRDEMEDPDEI